MLNKLTEAFGSLGDRIAEQAWFQQLKAKWDELDPQSQTYARFGGLGALVLGVLFLVGSSLWSVHKLKAEVAEKSDLLNLIQTSTEELKRLKDTSNGGASAGSTEPWPGYFEATAGTTGIAKTSINVSDAKNGAASETVKETLFDLALKHVNLRQVIRFAHALENGGRPVKLRNLVIDTKADPAGYLDATLSVSAFALAPTGPSGK